MPILRSLMLRLARDRRAEALIRRSRVTRPLVERFIAAEDLDGALEKALAFQQRGMTVSLDLLGENVHDESLARAARDEYLRILDRCVEVGIPGNISIKLTMLGLDISESLAWENVERIVGHAAERAAFVRIDMESSAYVERTLAIFRRIHDVHPASVGIVLQSYLYRTDRDLEEMIERGARVRIVKGAYNEPDWIAWPRKSDVDRQFRRHIVRLLDAGNYPAIATHDDRMLRGAQRYAARRGIDRSRFEFQMIYGVRRDLQESMAREGYAMRIYVPFGKGWYPYFMRRLAERPANLFFIARQLRRG